MKSMALIFAGLRRNSGRTFLILAEVTLAFALFAAARGLTSAVNHTIASAHPDRVYVTSKIHLGYRSPSHLVTG